jgi:hypothetical protein
MSSHDAGTPSRGRMRFILTIVFVVGVPVGVLLRCRRS